MTRVVFMGSKAAGLSLCRLMCETLPEGALSGILCPDDRADARSELAAFEALAAAHGVPLRVVANRAETMAALDHLAPRYVLVHGWYQIVPVDDTGTREFFGFHYSPLPRYRGNAPLVWQILNGEPEIGISFFRFTSGMDEGPVAAQARFPLGENGTVADALEAANAGMLDIARRLLPELVAGTLTLTSQPEAGASYCGLRTPADGVIDWHAPARRVHDFVRAQSDPYPGAFTRLEDGQLLRIWRTAIEPRTYFGVPGAVLEVHDDWVLVACGEGAVRVLEASVDGDPDRTPRRQLRSLRLRLR